MRIEGRKITSTFWGDAWCTNLEGYSDFANRLPRGRTYVRNGSVVDLKIEKGRIKALVSGSDLYDVQIDIAALLKQHWLALKERCAGKIGSLVELLQGKLSKTVMELVTDREQGLFPKPNEIKLRCSCPDSAGMCKHVAAVMYGAGNRLDASPELLFVLRCVDHAELIEQAIPAVPRGGGRTRHTHDRDGRTGRHLRHRDRRRADCEAGRCDPRNAGGKKGREEDPQRETTVGREESEDAARSQERIVCQPRAFAQS